MFADIGMWWVTTSVSMLTESLMQDDMRIGASGGSGLNQVVSRECTCGQEKGRGARPYA